MSEVERWYDEEYEEWIRLERHPLEFDITKRFMDRFLSGRPLDILDIGGGPGRYAIYLAQKGHRVTLLDLSAKNIYVAKEKSKEYGVQLTGYIHGNALDLSNLSQCFDAILLMGPLYHLVKEEERHQAVEEALKRLKPGGIIFASFISGYAPVIESLIYLDPLESPQDLLSYIENGLNLGDQGFTTAYFSSPAEAQALMKGFKLEQLVFAGAESILGIKEKEIMALDQEQYQKWIEIGCALAEDPNLYGMNQHFLYVGQKKTLEKAIE